MIVASSLSVRPALFSATQQNCDPFTPSNATNSNTLMTVPFSATMVVMLYTSSSVILLPVLFSSQMTVERGMPVVVQFRLIKSPMAALTFDGSSENEGHSKV